MTAKSLLTWATGKEWKEVVTMVSSENCCVISEEYPSDG